MASKRDRKEVAAPKAKANEYLKVLQNADSTAAAARIQAARIAHWARMHGHDFDDAREALDASIRATEAAAQAHRTTDLGRAYDYARACLAAFRTVEEAGRRQSELIAEELLGTLKE